MMYSNSKERLSLSVCIHILECLIIVYQLTKLCVPLFKTLSIKSVYGENCSVCTVIRYSRVNIGIFLVSEASVLLKTVSVLKIYTFVAIQQQPIHFRSPEGKLVEKTFWSGYWLRSYWFYCVTVGLELQLLPTTTAPMLSKVIRMVKRSCKSLGRIPNGASCRPPTPTSPADNSLRSLAMPVANEVSFYSYCVGTAEFFKKGCYNSLEFHSV